MPCTKEISGLPVLEGCPSDSEYVLTIGATDGEGVGRYALRKLTTIITCMVNKFTFPEIDTIVGVDGILSQGDTSYQIGQETGNPIINIANQSVKVTIDGTRIYPQPITDGIFVGIEYGANNTVTINFYNYSIDDLTNNLGLQNGMKVIIDYVSTSIDRPRIFDDTFDNTFG